MEPTSNKIISVSHRKKPSLPCPQCKANPSVICYGFQENGLQRYICKSCKATFNTKTGTPFARLRTAIGKVVQCVTALVENQGLRNASRTFNVKRRELVNWMQRAGDHCRRVLDAKIKVTKPTFLEFDELYTYVHARAFLHYTWTCVDAVSKTWLGFHLSFERSFEEAKTFFKTFEKRVSTIAGASSDGLPQYAELMAKRHASVPFAQIVKKHEGRRLVEVIKKQVGPHTVADVEFVITKLGLGTELNTSAVERLNATLRSYLARLNRRTLKFSKHVGNLKALMFVFQAYYNFCLKQDELGTTPAVAAGVSPRLLSLRQVLTGRV